MVLSWWMLLLSVSRIQCWVVPVDILRRSVKKVCMSPWRKQEK